MSGKAAVIAWILLSAFCPVRSANSCGGAFPIELSVTRSPDFFQPLFAEFLPSLNRIAPTPEIRLPNDPRLLRERDSFGNWVTSASDYRELLETYSDQRLSAQVTAARAAKSASEALALAPDLPSTHRVYLAGAVAFRAGDLKTALGFFEQAISITDAPTQQLWARFMAGRTAAKLGQNRRSAKHFQALRSEVEAGATDPLGLAFTSLGEEAKLHFDRLKLLAKVRAADVKQQAVMHESTRRMVRLYLAQVSQERAVPAQYMSNTPGSGSESLRHMSVWLINQPQILEASISDVWVQAILSSYLLARSESGLRDEWSQDYRAPLRVDLAKKLLGAAAASELKTLRLADLIAYLAYEGGEFETAGQFAALMEAPIAYWVRAKLALRAGRIDLFERESLRAIRAFDAQGEQTQALKESCVSTRRSMLASYHFANDAPLLSLQYLDLDSDDARYIAEDHLSKSQLRRYIEGKISSKQPSEETTPLLSQDPSLLKPVLLGRELRDDNLPAAKALAPTGSALDYIQLRLEADNLAGVAKSASLFQAARLLRHQGDDFYGASIYRALYGLAPLPQAKEARYAAVSLAEQAAEWLPKRSQAYAAVLCTASYWAMPRNKPLAWAIYRRYVKNGAYQSWAKAFGTSACPAPEFAKAQANLDAARTRSLLRELKGRLRKILKSS